VLLVRSGSDDVETIAWERLEPGRFRAERALASGELYRGAVRLGASTLPFGPLAAPGGAEWDFARERISELRAISAASGGVERDELASVWRDRVRGSDLELREALLWSFLLVFLFEALVSRVGWRLPEIDFASTAPRAKPAVVAEEAPAVMVPAEETETAGERRRTRFARAKRGR
jgi:hypothetical protein